MLTISELKRLASDRLKDAVVLLNNKRYSGAIYLAGYAVELMLKLRICKVFRFKNGFPENKEEFMAYRNASNASPSFLLAINQLSQLKSHDLYALIRYSGDELPVLRACPTEWYGIKNWGPNMRYSTETIRKETASQFINNCNVVIQNL